MDIRATRMTPAAARKLASSVAAPGGWDRAYPDSALALPGGSLIAGRQGLARKILVLHPATKRPKWLPPALRGKTRDLDDTRYLWLDGDHDTLVALREALPFLQPRPTGKTPSFGFGDRTGMATPGHLLALQGSGFF